MARIRRHKLVGLNYRFTVHATFNLRPSLILCSMILCDATGQFIIPADYDRTINYALINCTNRRLWGDTAWRGLRTKVQERYVGHSATPLFEIRKTLPLGGIGRGRSPIPGEGLRNQREAKPTKGYDSVNAILRAVSEKSKVEYLDKALELICISSVRFILICAI